MQYVCGVNLNTIPQVLAPVTWALSYFLSVLVLWMLGRKKPHTNNPCVSFLYNNASSVSSGISPRGFNLGGKVPAGHVPVRGIRFTHVPKGSPECGVTKYWDRLKAAKVSWLKIVQSFFLLKENLRTVYALSFEQAGDTFFLSLDHNSCALCVACKSAVSDFSCSKSAGRQRMLNLSKSWPNVFLALTNHSTRCHSQCARNMCFL